MSDPVVLPAPEAAVPEVPFHDIGASGAVALLEADEARARRLLALAERRYGRTAMRIADGQSRRWLARTANPYLAEMTGIAARIGRPGVYMLNMSFEWTCTAGVGPDPDGSGARLVRTLDWRLDGLGENLVVARHESPAGTWLSATWPGFVGALTVVAPGRFAAAINQPPMRLTRLGPLGIPVVVDWFIARAAVARSSALPPTHLLRHVAETAATYAEARRLLTDTPVCIPVFFTLCGLAPNEGCLIERLERQAHVFEAPVCAANHWLSPGRSGRLRTATSAERRAMLEASMGAARDFDWLTPPVLNHTTRLAAVANPSAGTLLVLGIEQRGPVTAPTRFTARPAPLA